MLCTVEGDISIAARQRCAGLAHLAISGLSIASKGSSVTHMNEGEACGGPGVFS